MGRDPLEIREDINLAGRALSDAVAGLQRRGWLPFVTLVDRTLQVATTLAAIERFRERSGRRAA